LKKRSLRKEVISVRGRAWGWEGGIVICRTSSAMTGEELQKKKKKKQPKASGRNRGGEKRVGERGGGLLGTEGDQEKG